MDRMHFHAQSNFAPVYNFPQGNPMQHMDMQYPVHHAGFSPSLQYMFNYQGHSHLIDRNVLGDPKTESKPRLSKEEVEKLEKEFQRNPKPSSSVKGQLADELGLERPRINNWFQNRRAKAKQERKQEEYEARRAAEKAGSEPVSPDESPSSTASDHTDESNRRRAQPSSALFPNISSTAQPTESSCDNDELDDGTADSDSDDVESPSVQDQDHSGTLNDEASDDFRSPLSLDFLGTGPIEAFSSCDFGRESNFDTFIPSPQNVGEGQATMMHQGMPTPTDSFKSPPPPANIASRRNISRPLALQTDISRPMALQTAPLRSSSYSHGRYGPKTGLDVSKRMDPSSPGAAMRRIASTTGNIAGRIQKSCSGQRSPMCFNRHNTEALLHHARSPAGTVPAVFPGTTPPTPMTPAVVDQPGYQEPMVASTSSDDGSFMLSGGYIPELKHVSDLKTPPRTPGLQYGNNNFNAQLFGTGIDFHADQQVWTPFLQNEFSDHSLHNVPSYVDVNDGSVPTTPLYPNMMGSITEPFAAHGTMGNTQFDWDANEAVNSSRSSPNQSRSKQIQFTQNMTPQDYNSQDK